MHKCELLSFYRLPKLQKGPYKSRCISNFNHCYTAILFKHFISALTAVKDHVIKYNETDFRNSNVNNLLSIKNYFEVQGFYFLLSTVRLYTHHCHMNLSKQKCYLWSSGVPIGTQNVHLYFR